MILSFINIRKVARDLANVNEWKIMFDPYIEEKKLLATTAAWHSFLMRLFLVLPIFKIHFFSFIQFQLFWNFWILIYSLNHASVWMHFVLTGLQQRLYRNDPKFSDRQVWANSADPDQSVQGLHCLPFRRHRLDSFLYGRAT